MVMELLPGEALGSLLDRQGALYPHTAAHIAIQIAEALSAAHGVGIVHRDLKPDNVWLLEDGGLKVLDFGIARVLEGSTGPVSTTLTQVGVILGTPLYISPEAVARKKVGPAADLYALGVILFEMIAGQPPFVDDEPTVLCTMHLRERPPRLGDRRPETPPEIDALVVRLLEKDPRNRPRDAAEVIARLSQVTWAESDPTERPSPPVPAEAIPERLVPTVDLTATIREPPRFAPWWRSRAALAGGGALALAALIAAVIVASSDGGGGTLPPPPPPTETRTAPEPAPPEASIVTDELPPIGEPAPPADVEVRVTELPDGATLRWDGEPVVSPFRVPRDGRPHRLEASAPGHEPRGIDVSPQADVLIPLALEPRQRRPGKRPVKLQPWQR
jgi:serine/threonine-protein kinase